MIGTDAPKMGYLEFHPKSGKPPHSYPLQLGLNTIGTTIASDIRIKGFTDNPDSQFCIIDVQDNGVAILETKMKDSVDLNGSKMNKVQILKNKDRLVVAGKEFYYLNDYLVPAAFKESIKASKRQSVMPNFKVKSVSKIPVSTKSLMVRRSLSALKAKRDVGRRSCSSALPNRKKVDEWLAIQTPIFTGQPLQPSTSMKKVTDLSVLVRKSLFLKNKADTSTRRESTKSFIIDDLSKSFEEVRVPSPRGLKRNRESSAGSLARFRKRRKHDDHLVLNLSISRGDSFFDESSGSSTESTVQDSPLAIALYELLSDSNSNNLSVQGVKKLLKTPKGQKSPLNDLTDVRNVQNSPRNDLTDVKGVKRLLRTPKVQNSPRNDLTDVKGIKKMLRTPKVQKSPLNDLTVHVGGVKKLLASPKVQKSPVNDLSNVQGVKKFLRTPKLQKSPLNDLTNVAGVKKLLKTPKIQKSPLNDLTDVRGVKKFLRTPKIQKSPNNDLSDVRGVKKLLKTPKVQKSPRNDLSDIRGVKKLMRTPKVQKEPLNNLSDFEGVKELMKELHDLDKKKKVKKVQKSPLNDLTDVRGVKKLLRTPKVQKSPVNDLSDVRGVKKLMIGRKEPLNDLSDFEGVEELFVSPKVVESNSWKKVQKSPLNDLTHVRGVKKLLKTPKVQKPPRNDLSDVRGVKKLMRSPKTQKEPLNDLSDLEGVKELMNSPKINESLNATLEEVYNELLNNSAIHNSTGTTERQRSASPKVQKSTGRKRKIATPMQTPDREHSLSETIQVSQRGRRIRRKRFDDDFEVASPRQKLFAEMPPKRNLRSRKKVDESEKQVSVNLNVDNTNLKKSEQVEMPPKRTVRGRKKVAPEDIMDDGHVEVVVEKRGRRKKNAAETVVQEKSEQVDNPNLEIEVAQTRNVRGRKKKIEDETATPQKRGRRKKVDVAEEADVDENAVEEATEQRSVRGKQQNDADSEKTENDVPEKRSGRGRKKKDPEAVEEDAVDEPVEEKSRRGRRKNEKTEEVVEKRTGRGQRKVVEEAAQEVSTKQEKQTRGRKKAVVETNDDDAEGGKKPTRASKRKPVEATVEEDAQGTAINDDQSSSGTKVKRTRKGRGGNQANENESQQEDTVDSTNVQKTHNTRKRGKK